MGTASYLRHFSSAEMPGKLTPLDGLAVRSSVEVMSDDESGFPPKGDGIGKAVDHAPVTKPKKEHKKKKEAGKSNPLFMGYAQRSSIEVATDDESGHPPMRGMVLPIVEGGNKEAFAPREKLDSPKREVRAKPQTNSKGVPTELICLTDDEDGGPPAAKPHKEHKEHKDKKEKKERAEKPDKHTDYVGMEKSVANDEMAKKEKKSKNPFHKK